MSETAEVDTDGQITSHGNLSDSEILINMPRTFVFSKPYGLSIVYGPNENGAMIVTINNAVREVTQLSLEELYAIGDFATEVKKALNG